MEGLKKNTAVISSTLRDYYYYYYYYYYLLHEGYLYLYSYDKLCP